VSLAWALVACAPRFSGGAEDGSTTSSAEGSGEGAVEDCGDGMVAADEECDDGNREDDDGCDADCIPSRVVALGDRSPHCVITRTGNARCWSYLDSGPLGETENFGDDEPASAAPITDLGARILRLVDEECAIVEGGGVRCFGSRERAGYGTGTECTPGASCCPYLDVPTCSDLELHAAAVWLGVDLPRCVVIEGGGVRCWGTCRNERLDWDDDDNPAFPDEFFDTRCLAIPGLDPLDDFFGDQPAEDLSGLEDIDIGGVAVQVAVGNGHICALLDTGRVRCWGPNQKGQLGQGHTEYVGDDEPPAAGALVELGADVVTLAAADYHTCALLENGEVRCWGSAGRDEYDGTITLDGELGLGIPEHIGDDEVPLDVPALQVGGEVEQLTPECVLLRGGDVRCWGIQPSGYALGEDHVVGDDDVPADYPPIDIGGRAVQVTSNNVGACVLLDTGAVRCWGHYAVGYGTAEPPEDDPIGDDETPAQAGDVPIF
jgi:cysteine-rich repeat protein